MWSGRRRLQAYTIAAFGTELGYVYCHDGAAMPGQSLRGLFTETFVFLTDTRLETKATPKAGQTRTTALGSRGDEAVP